MTRYAVLLLILLVVGCPPPIKGRGPGKPAPPSPTKPDIQWEAIPTATQFHYAYRAKTPTGWLVFYHGGGSGSTSFVPDPEHVWGMKEQDDGQRDQEAAPRNLEED